MSKSQIRRISTQTGKPMQEYRELHFLQPGAPALIKFVKGHHNKTVRGDGWVRTSIVVKYLGVGCFETLNTIYYPRNSLNYDKTVERQQSA